MRNEIHGIEGSSRRHHTASVRAGFTLVELLVVISIIGILVALITPAIFSAVNRAKTARISIEIAAMSQAMEQYRTQYGQYPPDLSFVGPANLTLLSSTTSTPNDHTIMGAHLQRSFRVRKPYKTAAGLQTDNGATLGADALPIRPQTGANSTVPPELWYPAYIPPTGAVSQAISSGTPLVEIDPAEALVLWLSGFSPDPQHPMRGQNHTPLFEFDKTRLVDHDGDGYPTYYPPGDKTQTPYIYYAPSSGNEGDAYDVTSGNVRALNESNSKGIVCKDNQSKKIPLPHRQNARQVRHPHPDQNGLMVEAYAGATKFQIISAGLDGLYVRDTSSQPYRDYYEAIAADWSKATGYNANPVPKAEKDNLSNFCEKGTFQDAVED